jgi:MYXO-CTERM domain-containing protein
MRILVKRSIVAAAAVLPFAVVGTAGAALFPYTGESSLDVTELYATAAPTFVDIDGDGDQDVVVATSTALWWYENEVGLVGDMPERSVDPTLTVLSDAAAHDLDGDGDIDLVASGGNGVRWYENVEQGSAFVMHEIDAEGLDGQIDAGDVDGDGDIDVILADSYDDRVLWYVNPGDAATWAAPTEIPTAQVGAGVLLVFDADGDGRSDVLVSDGEDYVLRLLRYDDGPWTESAIDPGSGAVDMRAVDIDADGDLDVLCGQARHAVILRNLGDGLFGIDQLDDSGDNIIDFRLDHGDVDLDGDDDIVAVTHGNAQAIRWYANEDGSWGAPQTILEEIYNSRGMDVADADCDGDADIVVHGSVGFWEVALMPNEHAAGPGECDGGGADTTGGDESTGGGDESSGGADDGTSGDDAADTAEGPVTSADEAGSASSSEGTGGPPQDDDDGGGGCSVTPERSAPIGMMAMLVLALAGARRRGAG